MDIAVIANVYGNMKALEKVLMDCRSREINLYILLGNIFKENSDPNPIYDLLKELPIIANIRGDMEKTFYMPDSDWKKEHAAACNRKYRVADCTDFFKSMTYHGLLKAGESYLYMVHEIKTEAQRGADILLSTSEIRQAGERLEHQYWNPGSVSDFEHTSQTSVYGIIHIDPEKRIPSFQTVEVTSVCSVNENGEEK